MNDKALATRDLVGSLDDLLRLSETLIKSGMLPQAVKTKEAAAAIILKGREIGMPVMESFSLINVIVGKPTIAPQGMLALIYRSRQLENLTITDDGKACTVTMSRIGGQPHTEKFSMTDAARMMTKEEVNGEKKMIPLADKYNWRQMPEVMRKWRAISACARIVFPDVIAGMYTPEELGAEVNDDGEVVEGTVEQVEKVEQTTGVLAEAEKLGGAVNPVNGNNNTRPFPPEVIRRKIEATAQTHQGRVASQTQRGLLAGVLELCFPGDGADSKRHSVQEYLTGYPSLNVVTDSVVLALLDWVKPAKDSGGAWLPEAMAAKEAGLILRESLIAAGQQELPETA